MFALVDCNNFYASCERLFKPELRNKPIVVLSNNDGCVIARSNEAKALGIPMGAPAFKFKDEFKKNGINVFSSNYALYGDMSMRVMNTLSTFTPDIEVYSIDEAFLKFDGFELQDLPKIGKEIRRKTTMDTGIPISVGFAPTKALAKVANKIAKRFPDKTDHVFFITDESSRIKALKWLKIEDVWGIGRRHAKRLQKLNVKTAYDFTMLPDEWVRKELSVVGFRLKRELEGKYALDLEEKKAKKAIATTRSFEEMYDDIDNLQERVSTFAVSCAEKLRVQNSCCSSIMVFLHTNGFREDLQQYSKIIVVKTEYPINSNFELVKYAVWGLKAIFKHGYKYKKAGVIVSDITPAGESQLNMFTGVNPKHNPLMKSIDSVNRIYGKPIVKLAVQDLKRTWKMNQHMLSPRYTTKLSDIITVNV